MNEEVKTTDAPVEKVLDVDGPRLMYTSRFLNGSVGTFQAYRGMQVLLNNHFKTDARTTATLEFAIGGRAVISPNTEIVVAGQRQIVVAGNVFTVTAGKIWANIDKQQSQLQIQPSGGTIGIEG